MTIGQILAPAFSKRGPILLALLFSTHWSHSCTYVYTLTACMILTDESLQLMPYRLPKYCTDFIVYLYRDRQDYSSLLYSARYRYVLRAAGCTLCAQDVEHIR